MNPAHLLALLKRRSDHVYLILSGVTSLAFWLVFTINMIYQATTVGLNPLQLVLVGTVLEVTALLCEVPTGIVADMYSRRLSVIIGNFLLGMGFIVESAIPRFETILVAQVILGLGFTFISGATEAWLADEIGEDKAGPVYIRGTQIGQITGLLGTGLSIVIGSILITLPILLGGVTLIGLGVFLIAVMPENGFVPAPTEDRTSWQTMLHTFRSGLRLVRGRPALMMILAIGLFHGLYSEGYDRLWTDHMLTNFTFPMLGQLQPVVWFGIMRAGAMLLSIVVSEVARRQVNTNDHRAIARALLVINVPLVASLVIFGLTGNVMVAILAFWSIGTLRTINTPIQTAWINQHVESGVRATVISMSAQVDAIGQVIGGPIIGAAATLLTSLLGLGLSLRIAMILTGVVLSPVLLLYLRAMRQRITSYASAAEIA